MIVVCMGSNLKRDEMEKWFARSMTTNPDNDRACERKLNYLNPKWQGTQEEFYGFGWKLARCGNTTGHLPFSVVRHHNHHSRIMGEWYRKSDEHARGWYAQPAAWTVILRALETQLAAKPKDRYYRSLLARIACIGKHYDVARAQFEILGDGFHPSSFDDRAEYDKFRTEARNALPAEEK